MKRMVTNSKLAILLAAMGSLLLSTGAHAATPQATYYVFPTGNDANPGTQILPFRTIAKARDVVRTANTAMTGDIVVTLRGGTYSLDSTITFSPSSSRTNLVSPVHS